MVGRTPVTLNGDRARDPSAGRKPHRPATSPRRDGIAAPSRQPGRAGFAAGLPQLS